MMRARLSALVLGMAAAAPSAAAPADSTPWAALRDPFQRPVAPPPAAPVDSAPAAPPRLRALVLNAQQSLANIDGHIVAVGEQFLGYTVRRIDARGVLIVRDGHAQLLTMQDKESP